MQAWKKYLQTELEHNLRMLNILWTEAGKWLINLRTGFDILW